MRFFTMDWWQGIQSGSSENPSDAYNRHLTSLRPFPSSVARLEQLPSLHDAHVRQVEHLGSAVEVSLETWGEKGGWIPVRLSYGGVEKFELAVDAEDALSGPGGFGDLGYYEIDAPSAGVFEHRLLFSSGIELRVRFREFNFSVNAVQQGVVADGAVPMDRVIRT
jgi:hypothetical protein